MSSNDNKTGKLKIDSQTKDIILFILKELKQSSAAKSIQDFYFAFDRMNMEFEDQINVAIIEQIINPNLQVYEPSRYPLTYLPSNEALSLTEISYLEDVDYWSLFHLSRHSVLAIAKKMKVVLKGSRFIDVVSQNDEVSRLPLERVVELVLWYLRNEDGTLEEGASIFELGSARLFERMLQCGLKLLHTLQIDSGMFMTVNNFDETAKVIYEKYKVQKIVGIMSYRVFTSKNLKRLFLQVVCNEKGIFKSTSVSYDTRPRIAILTSRDFTDTICSIPDGFMLAANGGYSELPRKLKERDFLFLPEEDSSTVMKRAINKVHKAIIQLAEDNMNELVERFPRLAKLHDSLPEALLGACVLHNYSKLLQDKAPLL